MIKVLHIYSELNIHSSVVINGAISAVLAIATLKRRKASTAVMTPLLLLLLLLVPRPAQPAPALSPFIPGPWAVLDYVPAPRPRRSPGPLHLSFSGLGREFRLQLVEDASVEGGAGLEVAGPGRGLHFTRAEEGGADTPTLYTGTLQAHRQTCRFCQKCHFVLSVRPGGLVGCPAPGRGRKPGVRHGGGGQVLRHHRHLGGRQLLRGAGQALPAARQ